LSQHAKFSGERLDYFDEATGTRFVPHIVEASIGLSRAFVAFLHDAYTEETLENGETRIVLKFDPRLAPVKAAVLPLQKKDGLADLASQFTMELRKTGLMIEYDDSGSIGKRYRRQDEVGTPWCVTVDYQTKEDQTVTIRHRDSMKQERVSMKEIASWLEKETRWVR
jgi:glycyl-tRNA synthetase